MTGVPHPAVRSIPKRLLDVSVAAIVLIATLPVTIVVTLAIWISMGPPALFKQVRPGLGEKPFTLMKFRTMRGENVAGREAIDDEVRLTALGRFLRRTSADEIPQMLDVLKGDMTLVGPRPLLVEYLPLYSSEQRRRHDVRPGITGWTQVCGRNALSWEEKFRLDVWYVDNWSFMLDLRILMRTVGQVVTGAGVSAGDHVTMERFQGDGAIPPQVTRR